MKWLGRTFFNSCFNDFFSQLIPEAKNQRCVQWRQKFLKYDNLMKGQFQDHGEQKITIEIQVHQTFYFYTLFHVNHLNRA